MKNHGLKSLLLLSLSFTLVSGLPLFVMAQYKITKEISPAPAEYQMQLGDRERPNKYIQPSLFIYNKTKWAYSDAIDQLRRADFILQQCGVAIHKPNIVFIDALAGHEVSDFKNPSTEIKIRLKNIPNIDTYSRPYVFLMDDALMYSEEAHGNSQGFAITEGDGKKPYSQFTFDMNFAVSTIVMSYYAPRDRLVDDTLNYYINLILRGELDHPLNTYNVLAHELVHSVGNVGHDSLEDSLMNEDYGSWKGGYLTEHNCERLRNSVLTKGL